MLRRTQSTNCVTFQFFALPSGEETCHPVWMHEYFLNANALFTWSSLRISSKRYRPFDPTKCDGLYCAQGWVPGKSLRGSAKATSPRTGFSVSLAGGGRNRPDGMSRNWKNLTTGSYHAIGRTIRDHVVLRCGVLAFPPSGALPGAIGGDRARHGPLVRSRDPGLGGRVPRRR